MSVLHLLPTFDTGGLGSLGLTMIRAWPESTRHIAVAPRYPQTKPDLFGAYVKACGNASVVQLDKPHMMTYPVWADVLSKRLMHLLRGAMPTHVVNYNFTDVVWNGQGVRRLGYSGPILCHVGTVLPNVDMTRLIAGAPVNKAGAGTTFVPASEAAAASVRALLASPERVLAPVWNGVDPAVWAASAPVQARTFGFSGRMPREPVKDWWMLLEAFRLAQKASPGIQLRIAGDGPGRSAIERTVEGTPGVEFVGSLHPDQMPKFLASLDVFVMAALPIEGFSMALVEAIVAGRMVLGADVPSVREVFAAGNGVSWLASNPLELAQHMLLLNENLEARTANLVMVERLMTRLTAARMAQSYFEAGR